MKSKPRVRFCWECGRQLYGNHHREIEIDGHKRILHKECANDYIAERKAVNDGKSDTNANESGTCYGRYT